MSERPNSVDAFLNHRANERESGGGYLSKWKKNQPPTVDIWLHTGFTPTAVWQHKFPRLFVKEDKETHATSRQVWGGNYTCHEDESVLKAQYRRDRETGARKLPPKKCPLCRMIETIHELVDEGQLGWTAPVFRFEGDEKTEVLHAGGIYNSFQSKNFNDQERIAFRESKISPKDAWRENSYAKCNYLFVLVDNDHPDAGVQVAVETSLLGDKVKDVINDQIKAQMKAKPPRPELGNPFLNPYAIQWEFDPAEGIAFDKKYSARKMDPIALTPAIEKLIRGPLPDVSGFLKPFNMETMRGYLERHCLIQDFPWDHVFNVESGAVKEEEFPVTAVAAKLPPPLVVGSPIPASVDPDACPACGKTEAQGCQHVACDDCEKPMLTSDAKCAHCGKVYREEPPPTVSPKRKRSEAAAPPPSAKETGDKVGF